MNQNEFKSIVKRVLEEYDIDDRTLAVDDFLKDLITTLEYEGDLSLDDPGDEEEGETYRDDD